MKETKPSINKCKHGVYDPSGTGVARYCTFCTEPEDNNDPVTSRIIEHYSPYPHGKEVCPICNSKRIDYKNDYDFSCPDCGFDAMTN